MKISFFRKIFSLWICASLIFVFFTGCTPPSPSTVQSQPAAQESSSVAASTLPTEKTPLESYTLSQQDIFSIDRFPIDTLASTEDFYFVFKEKLFRSDSASSELILDGVQQIAGYDENGFYLIVNDSSVPIIDKASFSMQMKTSLAYYSLADKTLITLIPGAQSAVVQPGSNDIVFYSAVIPYEENPQQNTRWAIIRHQLEDGKETILYTDNLEDNRLLYEQETFYAPIYDDYKGGHSYDILLSLEGNNVCADIFFPFDIPVRVSLVHRYNWEGKLLEVTPSPHFFAPKELQEIDCGGYTVKSLLPDDSYAVQFIVAQTSKIIGESYYYYNHFTNNAGLFYYYHSRDPLDGESGWSVFDGKTSEFIKSGEKEFSNIYSAENAVNNNPLYASIIKYGKEERQFAEEDLEEYVVDFYQLTGTAQQPASSKLLFSLAGKSQGDVEGLRDGYAVLSVGNFMLFLVEEPTNFVTLDVNTNQFTAYNPALLS